MNSLIDKITNQDKKIVAIQTSTKKSEEILGKILVLQEKEAKKAEKDRRNLANRLKREQQNKKRLSADRQAPSKIKEKLVPKKKGDGKGLLGSLFDGIGGLFSGLLGSGGLLKALGLGAIGSAIAAYIASPEFREFINKNILEPIGNYVKDTLLPEIKKTVVNLTDKVVRSGDSVLDEATKNLPAVFRNRNRLESPVQGMQMTRNDTERLLEFAKGIRDSDQYKTMSESERAFTDALVLNAKKMDDRMKQIYNMSSQIERREITLKAQKDRLLELQSQNKEDTPLGKLLKKDIQFSEDYIKERKINIQQSRVILESLEKLNFKVDNQSYADDNFIIEQINRDRSLLNEAFGRNTPMIKRASGGPIMVPGSGSGDTVPALLPPGSFVLNRNATDAFFQKGGQVPAMLEPGEAVFQKTTPSLEAMNKAVPRFGTRKDNGAPSENTVRPQGYQKGGKVFLHWAGSKYSGANEAYHATIQGDGSVSKTRDYNQVGGGHTHLRNTQGIGISLAAMYNATDKNFGAYPVKQIQYDGMAKLVADIATSRGWSPSDINVRNVMTHAEAASGKDGQLPDNDNYGPRPWGGDGSRWDLWKLYQNDTEGTGGDKIRTMIKNKMNDKGSSSKELGDFQSIQDKFDSAVTPTLKPKEDKPFLGDFQPIRDKFDSSIEPLLKPKPETPDKPKLDILGSFMKGFKRGLGEQYAPLANFFSGLISPITNLFGGSGSSNNAPAGNSNGTSNTTAAPGSAIGGATNINDANSKALLNAIAEAEGTSQYPEQGYRTMFTGKQFTGEWKHPRKKHTSNGYTSDAAGRYQFLSTTWDEMKMPDFSPINQDKAALKLASQARVNLSDGLSEQETYRVGQKWASVEGGRNAVKGGSYGGQVKYSAAKFMEMYKGYGGQLEKKQKGGMVGAMLEPGESVFLPHMMNEAVPRFQAGGSVKNISNKTGDVTMAFREASKKRLSQREVNNIIVVNGGGGRQRSMPAPQVIEPGLSPTVPSLPSGPSDSVNSVIRQIRMHAIG